MSADRGRRIAVVILIVLLSVTPVVTVLPGSPGSVRVAGVTLLWWYAALIGPLIAGVTAVLARAAR
jgi:hypothetical protein